MVAAEAAAVATAEARQEMAAAAAVAAAAAAAATAANEAVASPAVGGEGLVAVEEMVRETVGGGAGPGWSPPDWSPPWRIQGQVDADGTECRPLVTWELGLSIQHAELNLILACEGPRAPPPSGRRRLEALHKVVARWRAGNLGLFTDKIHSHKIVFRHFRTNRPSLSSR